MGNCLDMKLPGTLTNASALPFAEVDAILTTGSLVLWEPGHSVNPYSGVPAEPVLGTGTQTRTTLMPNLAARSARALTGAGSDADVAIPFASSMNLQADGTAPAGGLTVDGKNERTTKGGLHIIQPLAGQQAFKALSIGLSSALRTYLFNNQSHNFYWSVVGEITRAGLVPDTGPYVAIKKTSGGTFGWMNTGKAGHNITPDSSGFTLGARNTVGKVHEHIANDYNNASGNTLANVSELLSVLFGVGLVDSAYGDHGRNRGMSVVLYRLYLEDLSVSGRSYATVRDLDAEIRSGLFAAGGRYNGDSWATNPSTFP